MSAPNLREIEWAICELEKEESSFQVYAKLADLYAVRNEMLGHSRPQTASYLDTGNTASGPLRQYGESEFLCAIAGRDPSSIWPIMDELMETLHVVNPRAYDSVMRKIDRL